MSTRQGMYSRPRSDRSDTALAKTLEHDPARFCRNLPEPARSVLEPFERSGKRMPKALYSVTVFPRAAPADIARTRSDSVRTGTAPKNNDNMTNFHELIEGFLIDAPAVVPRSSELERLLGVCAFGSDASPKENAYKFDVYESGVVSPCKPEADAKRDSSRRG